MATGERKAGGHNPPGVKQQLSFIHTAVLQGIAVFFYSTSFAIFLLFFPICIKFCRTYALAGRRVLFLFVGKCRSLVYDCLTLRAEALRPSGFSRKFRRNGGITGEVCTQKSIYHDRKRL